LSVRIAEERMQTMRENAAHRRRDEGRRQIAPSTSGASELRKRVDLLELAFDNLPGGVALFDGDLRMVLCNRPLIDLMDYPPGLLNGRNPSMEEIFRFNARRGEYGDGDPETLVRHRMALARKGLAHCYDRTRPNGTIVEVRGIPLEGGGFVTTYFDVTDQRLDQQAIAHFAHHDALTDLPNRLLFDDRLGNALAQVRRGGSIAVLCLDLDGFKPVNDTWGHQAGDHVLAEVAERLRHAVRESDTVARLGGDEFAIIQTGIADERDALALAERLIDVLHTPMRVDGHALSIGVSIGIALGPRDGATGEALLRKADAALYRSKASGRGRFTFHSG
jgi:diguanylate cyclase (GGDEF)-like protein